MRIEEVIGATAHVVVAISGGKDSTAMALRLRELYPERDFDFVITPTYNELPEMDAHWKRLEEALGQPLRRVNEVPLFDLIAQQQMIPNYRARFCTRILKIEPMIAYFETLPAGAVQCVGLRADEEAREGLYGDEVTSIYPMREWGWTLDDVWRYVDEKGFGYLRSLRTDCALCFWQTLGEWRDLWAHHPALFAEGVELEERMGHTFRSPKRDTWPAALKELKQEFAAGRPLRASRGRDRSICRVCSL